MKTLEVSYKVNALRKMLCASKNGETGKVGWF